ncbi:MBL fold metallo-hydrolase [Propioniciclava soli]|uniref:MBL fold metallo-hydrolase n=1 Tax=Propioniciclava soli TaxID=2775081 RepID=UPI001E62F9D7|nr:MBL fold metallo-hydrolase [Propioniciclava soli]
MKITHLGHSAVLVEVADRRILFDPGNFSDGWHALTDLDAICVTHAHPDHIDPEHVGALFAANPDAAIHVEPGVFDAVELPERARRLAADASVELGGVRIDAVGGLHAVIHRDIPRIGNVGLVVHAEGEPTFFHPGDSLDAVPGGIDIVAVPVMGPWAALKEHIDFLRDLKAPRGFGIHNGLVNDRGWNLIQGRFADMTPTDVADLRGGEAWQS